VDISIGVDAQLFAGAVKIVEEGFQSLSVEKLKASKPLSRRPVRSAGAW
jgi:hypothetical protein